MDSSSAEMEGWPKVARYAVRNALMRDGLGLA